MTTKTDTTPLQVLAWEELLRHRWLESEKARCDVGTTAYQDWRRKYWHQWLRARIMEHLNGERFWEELDCEDYGLLHREIHDNQELVQKIVTMVKDGQENLCILNWAIDTGRSTQECIAILRKIDINNRRLSFYQFLK